MVRVGEAVFCGAVWTCAATERQWVACLIFLLINAFVCFDYMISVGGAGMGASDVRLGLL